MRARLLVLAACAATVLLLPTAALSIGQVDDIHTELADFDTRSESVEASAEQLTLVESLGAQAFWNRFGTPSSLVKHGGFLATGVEGGTAVAAARNWLEANKALFRLDSTEGLELHNDASLASSDGHAVSFRQTFGELKAADGGMVTVGLAAADSGWNVASISSTITGDETLTGDMQIGAEAAWQKAAASIGEDHSLVEIDAVSAAKQRKAGWDSLRVAGLSEVQRVRAVAFPTVVDGVLPAYEAIVLKTDAAEPEAYRIVVDGRNSQVLARQNLVQHSHEGSPPVFTFSGELPAADGACDERKGPYTVNADSHVRAIDVFASADNPLQDIVLRLYFGTTLVATADTLNSPERIRYAPSGGVPPGDYFVEVCEFDDTANTPPVEPRTYRGTVTLDTTAAPAPYLARWKVFPANPPLHTIQGDPWNHPSTDTRELWCWRAAADPASCNRVVGNLASRAPWDHDVRGNAPSSTTIGNNAVTAESWTHPLLPSPTQFRPVSATRDYSFPWTNEWSTADCNTGTPYGSAFVPGVSFDISAAVTNLFVMHNRMHDWSYSLGFTEENWNAQAHNFGLTETFRENDPVVGNAQAGAAVPPPLVYAAARDNANMITLPDGTSSITNMYFWQPLAGAFYAPCVDGDYDMGIIGHEYTHMIENRMIGKGANRTGHHAGAMGESVSDLLSIEQLNESGFVPTEDENRWATGTYATGNKLRGIRNYAGNFPYAGEAPEPSVYPQVHSLNFSDIGYDLTGPQVHADGEIWTGVNFDIRRALAAKYDASFPENDARLQSRCANGVLPPENCPGNRRWIQLVLDSFLLMPTAPSMLDARNAILAADTMRFGGENQAELWHAFARRGLGQFASSTNGTGRAAGVESDTNPLPDFQSPLTGGATVTFEAVGRERGRPELSARIYVGHYEARVSPIADTDPDTDNLGGSSNTLDAVAHFAPGTYEFVATAPGYGHVRFRQTFAADTATTIRLRFPSNWASASQGATATGDATPVISATSVPPGAVVLTAEQVLGRLIDDTEATNWQTAATNVDGAWSVEGKAVTIDLAGAESREIRRVQISAHLGPVFDPNARPNPADLAQNRFTALRQFEIWACDARAGGDDADDDSFCTGDDGFSLVYTSPPDAFPGDAPRPVAPVLILRDFNIPNTDATHLRVVVKTSQCTGGPDFQGEQDADPFNATDCDTAGPATTRFVRIAEVQAFTQRGTSDASEE